MTAAQYTAFLNAVSTTSDPYGLYYHGMATAFPGNFGVNIGISQSGSPGSYTYSVIGNGNLPVFDINWGEAARFCNWLCNGQPTAREGNGTIETGAYNMNGATTDAALMAVAALPHTGGGTAAYFLPTENEWYKACYYQGGGTASGYWTYPTQSNLAPSNSLMLAATSDNDASYYNGGYTDTTNYLTPVGTFAACPGPYGTYDMGGDVMQWDETKFSNTSRRARGGAFCFDSDIMASSYSDLDYPAGNGYQMGFRVASSEAVVPEPTSVALLLAGAVALGIWRLRRKA